MQEKKQKLVIFFLFLLVAPLITLGYHMQAKFPTDTVVAGFFTMDFCLGFISLAAAVLAGLLLLAACTCAVLFRISSSRYPPVAGTVFHQALYFRRLHDYHTQLSRKHKTFRLLSPLCHHIFTVDPTVVEHILKGNFENYGKVRSSVDNKQLAVLRS